MNIHISHTSEKPMYEQIEDGIRKAIYEGELSNNEMLPSVRQLAKDLNVSAITTKRAYIDLEHEGLIYTISGKGTFVRLENIEALQESREKELLEILCGNMRECRRIGIGKDRIVQAADAVYDEK